MLDRSRGGSPLKDRLFLALFALWIVVGIAGSISRGGLGKPFGPAEIFGHVFAALIFAGICYAVIRLFRPRRPGPKDPDASA